MIFQIEIKVHPQNSGSFQSNILWDKINQNNLEILLIFSFYKGIYYPNKIFNYLYLSKY